MRQEWKRYEPGEIAHIENVLNRLKAAPPPERVETHLTVAEAPLADTDRYDSLREEVRHA